MSMEPPEKYGIQNNSPPWRGGAAARLRDVCAGVVKDFE